MADYQSHQADFDALEARVVALSADEENDARGTAEQLGLSFPVLFGLDARATGEAIGAYTGVRKGRAHLQPSGFVLSPEGTVAHAVYSSGKVGRLTATDALTVLRGLVRSET